MRVSKVQTLVRRCVGDAAADLGLHFLHMSEGPFSHDAGHIYNKHSYMSIVITYMNVSDQTRRIMCCGWSGPRKSHFSRAMIHRVYMYVRHVYKN